MHVLLLSEWAVQPGRHLEVLDQLAGVRAQGAAVDGLASALEQHQLVELLEAARSKRDSALAVGGGHGRQARSCQCIGLAQQLAASAWASRITTGK